MINFLSIIKKCSKVIFQAIITIISFPSQPFLKNGPEGKMIDWERQSKNMVHNGHSLQKDFDSTEV